MLQLPHVTLCCVDAKNHALALRALQRSRENIEYARTVFLTDAIPPDVEIESGIEVIAVGPITSHETYSRIVLKGLYSHIATSHVLLVQWDGYVVNANAWTNEFLDYDYLGAPWPDGEGGYTVGNGGFSLRSRKLLQALQDDGFPLLTNTEDVTICGRHRPRLESDFGIRFAHPDLAKKFSFEMDARDAILGLKTFGFHGVFNLFVVESQSEIAALASQFSDSIARSEMTELLLMNLMEYEQYGAALAVGSRMLESNPDSQLAAESVVRARDAVDALLASKKKPKGDFASRLLRRSRASGH